MILKLTKQLFPTGRAFRIPSGGTFEKLLEGIALSEQRLVDTTLGLLNRIMADNIYFSLEDCADWEKRFAMGDNSAMYFDDRKSLIYRKYRYPGNVITRSSLLYIQHELQNAGFNVYLKDKVTSSQNFSFSQHEIDGEMGLDTEHNAYGVYSDILANYPTQIELFPLDGLTQFVRVEGLRAWQQAEVPKESEISLKRLLLILKPVEVIFLLNVRYV